MRVDRSAGSLRRSRLAPARQLVAAICYRIRKGAIEFLLVQTRSERWIFPKGGVECGHTHAQSAALEAFEEAGVHGRMEAMPFTRYNLPRGVAGAGKDKRRKIQPVQPALAVTAHLCEVSRLEPPQESDRNPTWFSAEKAKLRLRKKRAPKFGAELARVIDRASVRIRRVNSPKPVHAAPGHGRKDPLQAVRFEASEITSANGLLWSASYARYIRRERPSAILCAQQDIPVAARLCSRPILRLKGEISSSPAKRQKVQFINETRTNSRVKASSKSGKNSEK